MHTSMDRKKQITTSVGELHGVGAADDGLEREVVVQVDHEQPEA